MVGNLTGDVKIIVNGDVLDRRLRFDETQPHLKSLNPKFDDAAILQLNGKWRMAQLLLRLYGIFDRYC